jgi:16S rRNA (adenine1518-N6/adenine1519-N6)-dimethyltransferase
MPERPPRQTISYLKERFADAGVRIEHRWGQNFLTDLNILDKIVEAAELTEHDIVLEVGTGAGSLTGLLAMHAGTVIGVEIDPHMRQLASEELFDFENVTFLNEDALENKHTLNPRMVELLNEALAVGPDRQFKLVANLPYNIATPLIALLLEQERPPELMLVTVQKEVADRFVATPSTKDYGAVSVWVQSQCRVKIERTLPPSVFWPRPHVDSAVVRLEFDPELRAQIGDRRAFQKFAHDVMQFRRKHLAGVLARVYPDFFRGAIDDLLAELNIPPNTRAEELSVETLIGLFHRIGPTAVS